MDFRQVDFRGLDREGKREMLGELIEQNVHAHTKEAPSEAQMAKALSLGVEAAEIIEMSRIQVGNTIAKINGTYEANVRQFSALTGASEEEVREQYPDATPLWMAVKKAKGE